MHKRTIFTKEELLQMLEGKEVVYPNEKMKHVYSMEKKSEKKLILVDMQYNGYVRYSLQNNNISFVQCTCPLTRIETEKCAIQFARDDTKYVRGYRPDAAFCFGPVVTEYLLSTPNVIVSNNIMELIDYIISIENRTAEKELANSFELMRDGFLSVKEFTDIFMEFDNSHIDIMVTESSPTKRKPKEPIPLTKKETKDLLSGKKTPNEIRIEHGLLPVEELQNLISEWKKEFIKKSATPELVLTNNHGKVLKHGNAVLTEIIQICQDTGSIPTIRHITSDMIKLDFEGKYNNFALYVKEE